MPVKHAQELINAENTIFHPNFCALTKYFDCFAHSLLRNMHRFNIYYCFFIISLGETTQNVTSSSNSPLKGERNGHQWRGPSWGWAQQPSPASRSEEATLPHRRGFWSHTVLPGVPAIHTIEMIPKSMILLYISCITLYITSAISYRVGV